MSTIIILLLSLNFAHFLGDYTPLNKWFLKAKQHGKPAWLVAGHGMLNGGLYGIAVWLIIGLKMAFWGFVIEAVTHTIIDVLKGRINKWFPVVEDNTKQIHWTIMGADQLFHQIVLIFIACLCVCY